MKLCIIIPVHNEEEHIRGVIEGLKPYDIDIIVIDDGSTDNTSDILSHLDVTVLSNPGKKGKGSSLRAGFSYARQNGYDGVIAIDGDGQHAASDLKIFLGAVMHDPTGVINGSRMGNPQGMPFVRFWVNRVMSVMISWLCRQRIPDSQCGFRYIHKGVLDKVVLESTDFEIETELLIQAARAGFPIRSVAIQTIYSTEKSKVRPLRDTVRFIVYYVRECWRGFWKTVKKSRSV